MNGVEIFYFPGSLILMETSYLEINVISQITFLTLVNWKYLTKVQVYLSVNAQ